jgi:hypothetical protein
MKIVGSIIAALVLVLVILMLAKADDLTAAQQELKATIEVAQAKRFAALDKLRSEAMRVNAEVDRIQAEISAIHEEWKATVAAALKTYHDKERELDSQRQDYHMSHQGSRILQVSWIGGSSSSDPVTEINKVRQDFQTWVRENMAKYQDALKTAKPPFGARELEIEWHYQYQKKDLETQKKVYEIQTQGR